MSGGWLTVTADGMSEIIAAGRFATGRQREAIEGLLSELYATRAAKEAAEREARHWLNRASSHADAVGEMDRRLTTLTAKLERAEREREMQRRIADDLAETAAARNAEVATLTARLREAVELAREAIEDHGTVYDLSRNSRRSEHDILGKRDVLRARLSALAATLETQGKGVGG